MNLNKDLYATAGAGTKGTALTAAELSEYFPIKFEEVNYKNTKTGGIVTTLKIIAHKIEATAVPISRQNQNGKFVNGTRYFDNQIEIELPMRYYDMAPANTEAYNTHVELEKKAMLVQEMSNNIVSIRGAMAEANAELKKLRDWVKQQANARNITDLYTALQLGSQFEQEVSAAIKGNADVMKTSMSINAMIQTGKLPQTTTIKKSVNDSGWVQYKMYV